METYIIVFEGGGYAFRTAYDILSEVARVCGIRGKNPNLARYWR
jgi:hypothetical protein